MVLSFKGQFVAKIISKQKIHTIREDTRMRWKEGAKIHFATGVRTCAYNQFYSGKVVKIQTIEIHPEANHILIDGFELNYEQRLLLAKNDGFDSMVDFWRWFNKPFTGRLISWTKFNYLPFQP